MADAGEGLIDAQNRIQERMDEREEERARRAMPQAEHDPEQLRRAESLRWRTPSSAGSSKRPRTAPVGSSSTSALAELERQLESLGARPH